MREYVYDVALSFGGEDRSLVRRLAKQLRNSGLEVFFDEYEKWKLLGEDLVIKLREVYTKQAKFFIPIISNDYVNKQYPRYEFKSAIRAAFLRDETYILPLRLDNTEFDLLDETTSYIDLTKTSLKDATKIITEKVYSSEPLEEIVDINERIMEFLEFIAVRYQGLLSPGSRIIELNYLQDFIKQFREIIARFAPILNSGFYLGIINYIDFCMSKVDMFLNADTYDDDISYTTKDFGYDKLNAYMQYLHIVKMHKYLAERNYSDNIDLVGFGKEQDYDFLSRGAETIEALFPIMKQDFEKPISGIDYKNWFIRLCVFETNITLKFVTDDMLENLLETNQLTPLFSVFDEIVFDFDNSSIYDESGYNAMRDIVDNHDIFSDTQIKMNITEEIISDLSNELNIAKNYYAKLKNVSKYKRITKDFFNVISTHKEDEIIDFITNNKTGLEKIAKELKLPNMSFIVKNTS